MRLERKMIFIKTHLCLHPVIDHQFISMYRKHLRHFHIIGQKYKVTFNVRVVADWGTSGMARLFIMCGAFGECMGPVANSILVTWEPGR